MNPKLRGIADAMAKLNHNLDARADKLLQRIEGADARSAVAFAGAHKQLDDAEQAVADVETLVSSLTGANGAPSSAGGSQEPPLSGATAEPGASWSGKTD